MPLAGEALLVRRRHEVAVAQQGRGRVVIEAGDPENVHAGSVCFLEEPLGALEVGIRDRVGVGPGARGAAEAALREQVAAGDRGHHGHGADHEQIHDADDQQRLDLAEVRGQLEPAQVEPPPEARDVAPLAPWSSRGSPPSRSSSSGRPSVGCTAQRKGCTGPLSSCEVDLVSSWFDDPQGTPEGMNPRFHHQEA